MLKLIILIAAICLTFESSEAQPQAPEVKTEQQPDSGLQPEIHTKDEKSAATPLPASPPQILSDSPQRKGGAHGGQREDEGTEFWPIFHGYRLKITDTLVVAFTGLLFIATWALWLATRQLVRGAERTAVMQLRAYVVITDVSFVIQLDKLSDPLSVRVVLQNVGATPASSLYSSARIALIRGTDTSAELPAIEPSAFRSINVIGPNHTNHHILSLRAPPLDPTLPKTPDEIIDAIAEGTFWLVVYGNVEYDDVFGTKRATDFRYHLASPFHTIHGQLFVSAAGNSFT